MSLEATLAAVLQAEVDKRVAAVQAAADAWVAAFRVHAEALARGEVAQAPAPAAPAPIPAHIAVAAVDLADEMPSHMRPPTTDEDRPPAFMVTDSAAMAANMSVR
jgi:hypothetical protein